MKRMVAASVVALMSAQCVFGQNLLANGDLESPAGAPNESDLIDHWTLVEVGTDGAGMPLDTANFVNFANHTPAGARGLWFRSFMGGLQPGFSPTVDAILTQAVPGSAGTEYTLSAFYRYEPNYSGLDPFQDTQTILAIDFLDAADNIINSAERDVDAVVPGNNTWVEVSISGTAPAGTVRVQARASFLDGVLEPMNPQSAFVDDFTLVPEPATIACLIPALAWVLRRR